MNAFFKTAIICLVIVGLQAPALILPLGAFAEEQSPPADEEQEETVKVKGDKGEKGEDGENGMPGEDGEDGADGEPQVEEQPAEDGGVQENGEDGEDAIENEEETGEGDTVIETGNASSTGQVQNTGNTNVVNGNDPAVEESENVPPLCSDKTRKDEGKGEKEDEEIECVEEDKGGDTEVENNNTAQVENMVDIEADTGNNEASGNNGSSTIDTGDAQAIADIFNLVNTNIVDSNGLIVLLSNLKKQLLDFDLRTWAPFMAGYEGSCGEGCYRFGDLEVHTKNDGNIANSVVVRANTGGNEASDNTGSGTIVTGDAHAAANVVNIVNTNIINSNYLLFVANNFGSFQGDIVFPNSSSFFSSLFGQPAKVYDETEIENTNEASISNNVEVGAETGGNEAGASGTSVVQTGNSSAAANVFNQANMNLIGGNSFVALIRVSGSWAGEVFGLPEGISWRQTPNGIMLYSDDLPLGAQEGSLPVGEGEAKEKSSGKGSKNENSELEAKNTNNATISNDIQVFALTGDNKASGNGKSAIQTGNAQAVANVVNIANTNVIGKNWLFAIFNILGDFEGNISFGRPDLWIGTRAEIPNDPVLPGDEITYYLTVMNNGDAVARNTLLKSMFDDALFAFGAAEGEPALHANELIWDIGVMKPGDVVEFSFSGRVRDDLFFGVYPFVNTSSVEAAESDENAEDNTDVVELEVVHEDDTGGEDENSEDSAGNTGQGGGGSSSSAVLTSSSGISSSAKNESAAQEKAPNLKVVKSITSPGSIVAGGAVDYAVVITNEGGGSAYDTVLVDELRNEQSRVIHEEIWKLKEIFPDEEITITYTVVFEEDAVSGLYYNSARVEASNAVSNTAQIVVQVEGREQPLLPVLAVVEKAANEAPLAADEEGEVKSNDEEPAPIEQEQNPFLASLAESVRGYSGLLAAFAALFMLSLFFLIGRRLG